MSRFISRAVDVLATLLSAEEREAVRGDLVELQITGVGALRDVAGLVLRRQAAYWRHWRPWLAVMTLAIPLGLIFGLVARSVADTTSVYSWLYWNWWTWTILQIPRARLDLTGIVAKLALDGLTLVGWSWMCGVAMGSISRQTAIESLLVIGAVLFGATLGTRTIGETNPANAAVFSQPLFAVVVPNVLKVALVLLPVALGIRHAGRHQRRSVVLVSSLAAAVLALTVQAGVLVGSVTWTRWPVVGVSMANDPTAVRALRVALSALVLWPVVYVAADAVRRRSRLALTM